MDIFYGVKNKHRIAYYVFPDTQRMKEIDLYIREVAARLNHSKDSYTFVPVWVSGEDLWLKPVKGAEKKIAIVRAL